MAGLQDGRLKRAVIQWNNTIIDIVQVLRPETDRPGRAVMETGCTWEKYALLVPGQS